MSKLSDAQVAAIVQKVSGGGGAAAAAANPDPTTDMLARVWHVSAVVILLGGVTGGIVMIRRGWNAAAANFTWTRPSTWSIAGFISKL